MQRTRPWRASHPRAEPRTKKKPRHQVCGSQSREERVRLGPAPVIGLRLLIDRAGKVGTDHSIETAFEQPAIFEFVCHLSIKQRERA